MNWDDDNHPVDVCLPSLVAWNFVFPILALFAPQSSQFKYWQSQVKIKSCSHAMFLHQLIALLNGSQLVI